MRQLIVFITLAIVAIPQISYAEDEIIWQTEPDGRIINDIKVSPSGDVFYVTNDSIIEVRSIENGMKIDEILFTNTTRLNKISISDDARYMAVSGQTKYVIIYDLQERREVKRITALVFEKEVHGEDRKFYAEDWTSTSISADGKRITGIAHTSELYTKTNFLVIDIETEEILLEERRIVYDIELNPDRSYEWISAEYTPDGNYIVAQLDYGRAPDIRGPDTLYVYDAHTLELYDKVLNTGNKDMKISSYRPMFNYYNNNRIYIYDIQNRKSISTDLKTSLTDIVYSRNSDQVVYAFDFDNHIYDINTKEVIYEYENPKLVRDISIDNSTIIATIYGTIYGMKTFFSTTSVEDNIDEIVISPNPTSGAVNINTSCIAPIINYQINNNSGLFIEEGIIDNLNGNIQINFSAFHVGVYFLTIQCNDLSTTYKIIKEG